MSKFKLEQLDDANALANIWSCNLLRLCAQHLLDPTYWNSNSFVAKKQDSLFTFINLNRTVRRRQRARKQFELQFVADVRAAFAGPYLLNFELIFR